MGEIHVSEAGTLESREIGSRNRLDAYIGMLPAGILLFVGVPLPVGIVSAVLGGFFARAYLYRLRLPHPENRRDAGMAMFLISVCVVFGLFGWIQALTGYRVSAEEIRLGCGLCFLVPGILGYMRVLGSS